MTTPTTNHNPDQWTDRQGQFLAFIYAYTTIHRQAPAERDIERFFRVSAPSVHTMLKTLEQHGFIRRQPGWHARFNFSFPANNCQSLSKSNDSREPTIQIP
jgi:3-methyladenine DNA glycosylase Tag